MGGGLFLGERKMEVIILEGPHSNGKTTTLGMLYALMANKAGTKILSGPSPLPQAGTKDFHVLLEYTNKTGNTKKVALYTAGDIPTHIQLAIRTYTATADILVVPNATGKPSASFVTAPHTLRIVPKSPGIPAPKAVPAPVYAARLVVNMKDAQVIEAML
jgi:hypothetical protein